MKVETAYKTPGLEYWTPAEDMTVTPHSLVGTVFSHDNIISFEVTNITGAQYRYTRKEE